MPFGLVQFPVRQGGAQIEFENGFRYGRTGGAHGGIDIVSAEGMALVSPVNGRVVVSCKFGGPLQPDGSQRPVRASGVGNSTDGGNYAVVVDESRNFHYFAHMQQPAAVQAGQAIAAGTQIGLMGMTGNAHGVSHLHYQVWSPFTHRGCNQEYERLEFVYRFGQAINPYEELGRLAQALGARRNPGGRYFIPVAAAQPAAPAAPRRPALPGPSAHRVGGRMVTR